MTLEETIKNIKGKDELCYAKAGEQLKSLAMPPWALGRLMDLAQDLAGMTGQTRPVIRRKSSVVMAGDHGVCEEGVSAYPSEVTQLMVTTMLKGGAAINALARQAKSQVYVVDLGVHGNREDWSTSDYFIDKKVNHGTKNMLKGPAMSLQEARQSIEAGIEVGIQLSETTDVFGIGEMGIGNTTPATAILCAVNGCSANEVTGGGTGLDDEGRVKKASLIDQAIELHQVNPKDPLEILQKVGGFEIGGMVGLILAAASMRKPVIIDGLISTSAALIAKLLSPLSIDFVIPSHKSVEPGHIRMLEFLDKEAYFDLNLRLGEGTGAALVMPFLDSAVAVLEEMHTLDQVLGGA